MAGVGMRFAADPAERPNIGETLVFASETGMLDGDLRVLSVLVTWLAVHHAYVNADRLVRLVKDHPAERVRAFWAAAGAWLGKDRRFCKLIDAYQGEPVELLPFGTAFQIARRGEDERFAGTLLRARVECKARLRADSSPQGVRVGGVKLSA